MKVKLPLSLMKKIAIQYLLELALIWLAFFLYWIFPFADLDYSETKGIFYHDLFSVDVIFYLALTYSVISLPLIYYKINQGVDSKLYSTLKALKQGAFDNEHKQYLLFFGVKYFFIPLMLPAAFKYAFLLYGMLENSGVEYVNFIHYYNHFIFHFIVYAVFFLMLSLYSFGYLVETKWLNSKVKSVEPTIFGWAVTLICYAPFLIFTKRLIPFYTHNFAFFYNEEVTFVVRILLTIITLFMLWSVVSLGTKCSNLTNRGVVQNGAFRVVRHPHYLAKLLVWWINFIPLFFTNYWMIGGMIFWTSIYIFRALTEENHLSQDEDYRLYKEKVKWRFVPYVF